MFYLLSKRIACIRGVINLRIRLCSQSSKQFLTDLQIATDRRISIEPLLHPLFTPKSYPRLKESILRRGYDVDVKQLDKIYKKYAQIKKKFHKLSIKVNNLDLKIIENRANGIQDESLNQKYKTENTFLMKLKLEERILSETVNVNAIRLPNYIDPNTPDKNIILQTFLAQPSLNFLPKSHIEIGKLHSELTVHPNSPPSYYLKKRLSGVELACSEFFTQILIKNKFIQQSNPDIWKAIMVESCGLDHNDVNRTVCVQIQKDDEYYKWLYLLGGGSLPSFAAYFAMTSMASKDHLPLRLVSLGKRYEPQNDTISLFDSTQSTVIDACILCTEDSLVIMKEFENVLEILTCAYMNIGLHFELVEYNATNLKSYECRAIGFNMYSLHTGEYIEVARISLSEDYISRRMQATYIDKHINTTKHISMIYVQAVNVTKWIGLLLENSQNVESSYRIPDCIKSYMIV